MYSAIVSDIPELAILSHRIQPRWKMTQKELNSSSYRWELKTHTSFPWKEKHLLQLYSERSSSRGTWEQEILNDIMRNVSSSEPWAMQTEGACDGYLPHSIEVQGIIQKYTCYPKTPQLRHSVSPSVFYQCLCRNIKVSCVTKYYITTLLTIPGICELAWRNIRNSKWNFTKVLVLHFCPEEWKPKP